MYDIHHENKIYDRPRIGKKNAEKSSKINGIYVKHTSETPRVKSLLTLISNAVGLTSTWVVCFCLFVHSIRMSKVKIQYSVNVSWFAFNCFIFFLCPLIPLPETDKEWRSFQDNQKVIQIFIENTSAAL